MHLWLLSSSITSDHYGAMLSLIYFVLFICLIFYISSHPPSLNVDCGHLQEQVMFCFLRSVTVGILSVKLLKGGIGKQEALILQQALVWELFWHENSLHQQNVISWASFATRYLLKIRYDKVESCKEVCRYTGTELPTVKLIKFVLLICLRTYFCLWLCNHLQILFQNLLEIKECMKFEELQIYVLFYVPF